MEPNQDALEDGMSTLARIMKRRLGSQPSATRLFPESELPFTNLLEMRWGVGVECAPLNEQDLQFFFERGGEYVSHQGPEGIDR